MPNWTSNRLTVLGKDYGGTKGSWRDFGARTMEVVNEGRPFLAHYIPEDPRVSKQVEVSNGVTFGTYATVEEDGFDGWQWCLDNWGCKWPDSHTDIEIRDRSVLMTFETPWDVPLAGLLTISKIFHLARFKLVGRYEGGFPAESCRIQFQAGEITVNEMIK